MENLYLPFSSVELYGKAVQNKTEEDTCVRFHLENESGIGEITVYQVFPGIELVYNDMHMGYCSSSQRPNNDIIEINHCQQGRYECSFGSKNCCCMAPGSLSISRVTPEKYGSCFPLSHYHGIMIAVDVSQISQTMKPILESLLIDFKNIELLIERENCLIIPTDDAIEHIFSELYTIRENIRFGYNKLKVLELLLLLSDINPDKKECSRIYFSKHQIDIVKAIREFMIQHIDEHFSLEELSERFHISPTIMKKCYKAVYGDSIYAYQKKYKLQLAEKMLVTGTENISQIASAIGYENPAKFTSAFKKMYGLPPSAYQKKSDRIKMSLNGVETSVMTHL